MYAGVNRRGLNEMQDPIAGSLSFAEILCIRSEARLAQITKLLEIQAAHHA